MIASMRRSLTSFSGVPACGIPRFDHPGIELRNDIARSDDEALRWEVRGRGASFATDFDYQSGG